MFAYVGSYTTPERKGHGNGINVYRVDPRSGAFGHVQLLDGLENPSFLAIDKVGRCLYSVHGDRSDFSLRARALIAGLAAAALLAVAHARSRGQG